MKAKTMRMSFRREAKWLFASYVFDFLVRLTREEASAEMLLSVANLTMHFGNAPEFDTVPLRTQHPVGTVHFSTLRDRECPRCWSIGSLLLLPGRCGSRAFACPVCGCQWDGAGVTLGGHVEQRKRA